MSDWWLTIDRTDGSVWCWNLGVADDSQRGDLITRARALADVPVGDGVNLHYGQPHARLLERCTMRERAELDAVPAPVLADYRERMDGEAARVRRAAARASLAALDADDRAVVIAEYSRGTGAIPTPVEA